MAQCIIANESRILRHIIRRVIERRGFEVVEARDGPEVIDLCQTAAPALLCIDDALPEIDGISVMRLLRAEQSFQCLPPTVFTYIENDQSLLTRALAAGAQAFVQKPFTAAQLDAVVAKIAA